MAREKNTIPATLADLVRALNNTLADYSENLTNFSEEDVTSKDYAKAKKSLDDAHAAVLKLKDLHNGLYQHLPKAESTGKPKEHAAITMAKEAAAKPQPAPEAEVTPAADDAPTDPPRRSRTDRKPAATQPSKRSPEKASKPTAKVNKGKAR